MSNDFAEELKRRVPIEVQIARDGVKLQKAGSGRYLALCVFHHEKTPSMSVSNGMFQCFGCQASGDVITWMRRFHELDFGQAIAELANIAGLDVPATIPTGKRVDRARRDALVEVNAWAAAWFRGQLTEQTRAYLHGRGIPDPVIWAFGLGEAPDEWHALEAVAARNGRTEQAVELGLVAYAKSGKSTRPHDAFRGRVMCPIYSIVGRVIGFSGRRLVDPPADVKDGPPKYLNSPESPAFDKSAALFGLYQARSAIQAAKRCIVVEGNFDVMAMHAAGYTTTIGPCGTALTEDQVDIIARMVDGVTVLTDGDRAGQKATLRWMHLLLPRIADVEVAVLEDGVDPAKLVETGGRAAVDAVLGEARPAWDILLRAALPRGERSALGAKAAAFADVAPLLERFPPGASRDLHTRATAQWWGVTLEQVTEWLAAGARPAGQPGPITKPMILLRQNELQRIVSEAEAALAADSPDVYVRGQALVRLADADSKTDFVELSRECLNVRLDRSALWRTEVVSQDRDGNEVVKYKRSHVPKEVCGAVHSAKLFARIPLLRGIIRVPTLRPDGSVQDTPGYDSLTQTYYRPSIAVPAVATAPTQAEAFEAYSKLWDVYREFEFETDADHSAAVASLISAVVRPAMQLCPMFVFDGTSIAVGKGLCADVMAMTVTGESLAPVQIYHDEDKTQRGVEALLVAGEPFIAFDDLPEGRKVELKFLDRMLTSGAITTRQHYENLPTRAATLAIFAMTGNNLRLRSDMVQRCIRVRLVSAAERPEARGFAVADLLAHVKAHRGELIHAALTIVKAFLAAGGSLGEGAPPPNRRFIEWDHLVRHPLIWLGQPDPVTTQTQMKASADADSEAWVNFAECWLEVFGLDKAVTTTELALTLTNATAAYDEGKVRPDYELRVLLQSWVKGKLSEDVSKLGNTLSRFVGRRRGNARFAKGESKGRTTYRFAAAE